MALVAKAGNAQTLAAGTTANLNRSLTAGAEGDWMTYTCILASILQRLAR